MGIQVWQERVRRTNDSAESITALVDLEKPYHSERQSSVCSFCEARRQAFQQVMASRNSPVEWLIITEETADSSSSEKGQFNEQSNQLMRGILQAASVAKTAIVLPVDASGMGAGDNELSDTAQGCCRESLLEGISTIQPKLLLMFNETVAARLLVKRNLTEQGGALAQTIDGLPCPVIVTYGLSELLKNPLLKKKVWTDIQLALSLKN